MSATDIQFKVTVAKCLQLAYDKDREITLGIIRSGDHYSLSIDETGQGILRGSNGHVEFSANEGLMGLGITVRRATVSFSKDSNGRFAYSGTFRLALGTQVSISGTIDVIEMIKSCSGLLCQAARFLDGRDAQIEQELQQYID